MTRDLFNKYSSSLGLSGPGALFPSLVSKRLLLYKSKPQRACPVKRGRARWGSSSYLTRLPYTFTLYLLPSPFNSVPLRLLKTRVLANEEYPQFLHHRPY